MKKILIVEDDSTMRKALALMLKNENYQVQEARNGEEAVEILEDCDLDLIVSDLFLNGISGLDLFDKIKNRMPCLIITGFGDSPLAAEARQRAGDAYLEKPFSPRDFKDKVSRLLASQGAKDMSVKEKNKGGAR